MLRVEGGGKNGYPSIAFDQLQIIQGTQCTRLRGPSGFFFFRSVYGGRADVFDKHIAFPDSFKQLSPGAAIGRILMIVDAGHFPLLQVMQTKPGNNSAKILASLGKEARSISRGGKCSSNEIRLPPVRLS